jgi:hypothetical protein
MPRQHSWHGTRRSASRARSCATSEPMDRQSVRTPSTDTATSAPRPAGQVDPRARNLIWHPPPRSPHQGPINTSPGSTMGAQRRFQPPSTAPNSGQCRATGRMPIGTGMQAMWNGVRDAGKLPSQRRRPARPATGAETPSDEPTRRVLRLTGSPAWRYPAVRGRPPACPAGSAQPSGLVVYSRSHRQR